MGDLQAAETKEEAPGDDDSEISARRIKGAVCHSMHQGATGASVKRLALRGFAAPGARGQGQGTGDRQPGYREAVRKQSGVRLESAQG